MDLDHPTNHNNTPDHTLSTYPCNYILYHTINDRIRILDVILLVPNGLFLVFLSYGLAIAHHKFTSSNCPIVRTIYSLVFAVCVTGVARSFISMVLTVKFISNHRDSVAIKVLWLVLRCFVIAVELCVIIFALFSGRVDSRMGVRRVLFISSTIATLFTSVQAFLEFTINEDNSIYGGKYDLFKHGGMIFWFTSSIIFGLVYSLIVILPHTSLSQYCTFPSRKSFYWYCSILAVVNIFQSIGSGLVVFAKQPVGICMIDVTSIGYFTLFAPLVYIIFLSDFLSSKTKFMMNPGRQTHSYQPIPDDFLPQAEEYEDSQNNIQYYGAVS